jgi:murein DD-endopeptidase MepM/ murein hydrolase activator NlpD
MGSALSVAVVQANACGSQVAKDIGDLAAPAAPPKFAWPVRGRWEAACSDPSDGGYVNIAAPEGTIVRGAADGLVVYAGDGLKNYGNLILIRHDETWVTIYALNRELLVKRGQQVRLGQQIAHMGSLLHFEIRRGSHPVNPLDYLPAMP